MAKPKIRFPVQTRPIRLPFSIPREAARATESNIPRI